MTPYLYHLTGYRPDGMRIDRKYKTDAAMKKMARTMRIVRCACLFQISYAAIDRELAALSGERTTHESWSA